MPVIEAYDFGFIVIEGRRYNHDVIVFPDRVQANWWRKEGHALYPEDLPFLAEEKPEVLVVGTGKYGQMQITATMEQWLAEHSLPWEADITERAVRRFNQLLESGRQVVGAFHLTC